MRFTITAVQLIISYAASMSLAFERRDFCNAANSKSCDPSTQFPCCTDKFHAAVCEDGSWSVVECDNGCTRVNEKQAECNLGGPGR
jgi:hypothetical protein